MTADQPTSPVSSGQPRGPRLPNSGSSIKSRRSTLQDTLASPSKSSQPISSPTRSMTSPLQDKRDAPGSSRTKYHSPALAQPSPSASLKSSPETVTVSRPDSAPLIDLDDVPTPPAESASSKGDLDMDTPHAPYREPEAVIEPMDDQLPDYSIAEHPISDDDMLGLSVTSPPRQDSKTSFDFSSWQNDQQSYEPMDLYENPEQPDRPSIGPGVLPRRLLELVHEHPLYQPQIKSLPQSNRKTHTPSTSVVEAPKSQTPLGSDLASASTVSLTTSQSASSAPSSDYDKAATLADVWNACPGGEDNHREWFFCWRCWGWLRVVVANRNDCIKSMEEWELGTHKTNDFAKTRADRQADWSRYNDLSTFRAMNTSQDHHFHRFNHLVGSTTVETIERIKVEEEVNAFPHIVFNLEQPTAWSEFASPTKEAVVYVDSCSDMCVIVDRGLVPGLLAPSLVTEFSAEKISNPRPGVDGVTSAKDAWTLILTLLGNALFKKQRGWVQLENNKFKNTVGVSLSSSNILYQIGFGCRQEQDVSRVGPFNQGDKVTKDEADQMNRYMLRAWVEIGLYLTIFKERNNLLGPEDEQALPLETVLHDQMELGKYPPLKSPMSDAYRSDVYVLGASKFDILSTLSRAYDLQAAADPSNIKEYLKALEHISQAGYVGSEALQLKVATERSIGRYTTTDLLNAYKRIGYDDSHATLIGVEPEDAPEDYILNLHKTAMQSASAGWERNEICSALELIGRDRESKTMLRLAKSGQTFLSVDEAYAALSAPRDCIDDGLIMQYEMAVSDYPGKTDHYRMCMSIIADAPGRERPGIKTFLETGSREPLPPARKDIPVGLQNIGNTCYLNSILQYLYSIKPLREAVISFDQGNSGTKTPYKPEIERSRRFVRQLRLLFLQLYKSDQSSVRPEEELAYLAITRPEVDQIVEPDIEQPTARSILDAIPSIPSPSSTQVNTPDISPTIPNTSLPGSPRPDLERSSSILGKRASTDRDDSSRSSVEHSRLKSDGFEDLGDVTPIDEEKENGSQHDSKGHQPEQVESPSAVTDLQDLQLKSPEPEDPKEATVPPPLPPRPPLIKKDTLASGLRFGLQQDSAEVLINVLTQLELAFDPAAADEENEEDRKNIISELFSCKYRQQTFYASSSGEVEAQTPVESVFVHPIIGVEEEGKDLYDCLAELYLKGDEIEYEGKKGYMMDLMDSFPPMLYIQMRRSQYDPKTFRETKTNTHIAFDQVLCMDRFLSSAEKTKREESVRITREITNVRARLHQLRNNKSIPDTFVHAREALAVLAEDPNLEITDDFLKALDNEADSVKTEIKTLEEQLPELKRELDDIWQGEKEYEYELVSVFMHRGKTSGAGHYWTYQAYLPDHPEEFFKYNDELVTAVPASEVLEDRTGSDANPALLCYVRKGRSLIQTLHREILELEPLGDGAPSIEQGETDQADMTVDS